MFVRDDGQQFKFVSFLWVIILNWDFIRVCKCFSQCREVIEKVKQQQIEKNMINSQYSKDTNKILIPKYFIQFSLYQNRYLQIIISSLFALIGTKIWIFSWFEDYSWTRLAHRPMCRSSWCWHWMTRRRWRWSHWTRSPVSCSYFLEQSPSELPVCCEYCLVFWAMRMRRKHWQRSRAGPGWGRSSRSRSRRRSGQADSPARCGCQRRCWTPTEEMSLPAPHSGYHQEDPSCEVLYFGNC